MLLVLRWQGGDLAETTPLSVLLAWSFCRLKPALRIKSHKVVMRFVFSVSALIFWVGGIVQYGVSFEFGEDLRSVGVYFRISGGVMELGLLTA